MKVKNSHECYSSIFKDKTNSLEFSTQYYTVQCTCMSTSGHQDHILIYLPTFSISIIIHGKGCSSLHLSQMHQIFVLTQFLKTSQQRLYVSQNFQKSQDSPIVLMSPWGLIVQKIMSPHPDPLSPSLKTNEFPKLNFSGQLYNHADS